MREMKVNADSHAYPVYVGENLRFQVGRLLKEDYSSILIISDTTVGELYLEDIMSGINHPHIFHTLVPAGEASKNIEQFYEVHTKAIEYGLDRHSLIIALGGGVIGDLAGFVAATYMRGVDYVQIPTTILAHDSSVGGKVAVNHHLGKNLIGNFYPPKAVIYDVQTLESLDAKQVRSGYAELVKEAFIGDDQFLQQLLDIQLNDINSSQLIEHLYNGIHIKASIVEQDEKEAGIRKYLNLGHTLGHALEAEAGYGRIAHGEAVAIGILFALYVSEKEYGINLPYQQLLGWLHLNGYPLNISGAAPEALIRRMKSDKKNIGSRIQMILLQSPGNVTTKEINEELLTDYLTTFKRKLV
ncbi:3-dehydroquinate synthase [Virgibacillus xinjiangensis]|uniref:3-dehydroquinate synthase n=1 Tax=Virgibacillus xinjiangensis TaxID=393090 RepID=A0ABV7CRQ3_9BACI